MKVNWRNLQRGDVVAGACAAGAMLMVCLLFGSALQGVMFGAVFGVAVAAARHKYLSALRQRSKANGGPEWDVELNGVKIGTVSDTTYATIRLQAFEDMRLYRRQFLNGVNVLFKILGAFLFGVPLLIFWGLLLVAMFDPEFCAEVLNELRSATPASIAEFANFVRIMMSLGLITAVLTAILTGAKFGFVDCFSEATARALRLRLDVPAEGELVLLRRVDGAVYLNNELDALRRGA